MKRYVFLILGILIIVLALVGCGSNTSKESGKPSTSEKITISAAACLKGG